MNKHENMNINKNAWRQEGTYITNGKRIILIGDYVDYNPHKRKYKGKWIAIGASEGGNLMIMSEDEVGSLKLGGKDGVESGAKQLDAICEKYALGDNAVRARSLTVEDVEKMACIKSGFEEWTLKIDRKGTEAYYIYDDAGIIQLVGFADIFYWFDRETNTWNESPNTFQHETITTLKTYAHATHKDKVYNIPPGLSEKICNGTYWLATPCVLKFTNEIGYGMHVMTKTLFTTTHSMVSADGKEYEAERAGVRAVVYLALDAELEPVAWKVTKNNNEYA